MKRNPFIARFFWNFGPLILLFLLAQSWVAAKEIEPESENGSFIMPGNGGSAVRVSNGGKSKYLSDLSLMLQESDFGIPIRAEAKCGRETKRSLLKDTFYYLKKVTIGIGNEDKSLWEEDIEPENLAAQKQVRYLINKTFSVPVRSANQQSRIVDPVEIVLKDARKTGTDPQKRWAYFRRPHQFTLTFPIYMRVTCEAVTKDALTGKEVYGEDILSIATTKVPIVLRYEGDPELRYRKKLPLSSVQKPVSPNKTVRTQAATVDEIVFTQDIGLVEGECPSTAEFDLRFLGKGRGLIYLRVTEKNKTVYVSDGIEFKEGKGRHLFSYPFGQSVFEKRNKKAVDHEFRFRLILVRDGKTSIGQTQRAVKNDVLNWQHRCV
ncbi:hypothetical protein [Sneathiella aquimaris]|uniref:hypothetical protein n=1 Tax=Sneathiella aquimaris TaxID=2599305 RepID=UPI00146DD81C|nr:hypothetical protein [Sneathiella aquimaris]